MPRAGEWFKNSADLLGLFFLAAGVVGVVVCLAAAAQGRTVWAIGTGVFAGLALLAGSAWLFIEGRRITQIGIEHDDGRAARYAEQWRSTDEVDELDTTSAPARQPAHTVEPRPPEW